MQVLRRTPDLVLNSKTPQCMQRWLSPKNAGQTTKLLATPPKATDTASIKHPYYKK